MVFRLLLLLLPLVPILPAGSASLRLAHCGAKAGCRVTSPCLPAAAWVAVNVSGVRYELAVKAALPLLSQYFWGANKEGLRLQETVPLVTHYR